MSHYQGSGTDAFREESKFMKISDMHKYRTGKELVPFGMSDCLPLSLQIVIFAMTMKGSLFGKTLPELQQIITESGLPRYAAVQIAGWLYARRAGSIEEMTDLSKGSRALLASEYHMGTRLPVRSEISHDGTRKYLFETVSGKYVETAVIPEKRRITVCVSSQAGCKMGCLFCMTGKQGFQGQLTAGEILNQIRSIDEAGQVTNVVYMGMGEPFDNLEEVLKSIEILTSPWGYGMSPRRITVSTIGLIPGMAGFLEKCQAHLAVSLHSPFHEERRKLMPAEAAYPLQDVIQEIRDWDLPRQRRVSFEYIVFKDLNDTPRHASELAKLLNGLRCRINLIRFHPIPDIPLQSSSNESVLAFREMLSRKGMITTIRASRGQDIGAACGLLSTRQMVKNGGMV
jgi:23S rRNA (adenine2503-C2)-methyltransferase